MGVQPPGVMTHHLVHHACRPTPAAATAANGTCHEKLLRQPQVVHDVHACDSRLSSNPLGGPGAKNQAMPLPTECIQIYTYKTIAAARHAHTSAPPQGDVYVHCAHAAVQLASRNDEESIGRGCEKNNLENGPQLDLHTISTTKHPSNTLNQCTAEQHFVGSVRQQQGTHVSTSTGDTSVRVILGHTTKLSQGYEEKGRPMCGINVLRRVNGGSWSPQTHSHEMPTQSSSRQHHRHLVKTPHTCTSLIPSPGPRKGRPQVGIRPQRHVTQPHTLCEMCTTHNTPTALHTLPPGQLSRHSQPTPGPVTAAVRETWQMFIDP